jgi:hypothetical protein
LEPNKDQLGNSTMSRRTIQLENRTIIFSPDDPVPLANRIQAVLKLLVTDELTSKPPESTISLRVKEKGYTPRVASDGLAGLVAVPLQVIPKLDAQNYPVNLTARAKGYLTRELHEEILQDPSFPAHFAARQIDLALHREPVTISGRTVRVTGNTLTPLPGTEVSLTGIWRIPPPADAVVPPDPPNLIHLQSPLYLDRAALTQFLQPRDLPVVAGSDKTLLNDVSAGTDAIQLSDRQGLAVGDVLQIDVDQPDLAEFVEVKAVPTTSAPDQPTVITLNQELMQSHRRNGVVKRTLPQPAGTPRAFIVDATTGDTCVFLDNLTGLATGHEVQITGVPAKDEYHKLTTFSVLSDADGYYRLPPLSRVAQIETHAEKVVGIETFQVTTAFRPDYHQRENHLDLTLAV